VFCCSCFFLPFWFEKHRDNRTIDVYGYASRRMSGFLWFTLLSHLALCVFVCEQCFRCCIVFLFWTQCMVRALFCREIHEGSVMISAGRYCQSDILLKSSHVNVSACICWHETKLVNVHNTNVLMIDTFLYLFSIFAFGPSRSSNITLCTWSMFCKC
jgi:hypothetical protein